MFSWWISLVYLAVALILALLSGVGAFGSFVLYPIVLLADSPVCGSYLLFWFPVLVNCVQWVFSGLHNLWQYAKVSPNRAHQLARSL